VRHVLQEFAEDGHCAVHHDELIETAATLLEIPVTIIEQAVALECQEEHLIAEEIDGQSCLFLAPLQRAEVGVASHLLRLLHGDLPWGAIDSAKQLSWLSRVPGIFFSFGPPGLARTSDASALH
jgi:exodeoxyribonuclease V alpha subunit